MIGMVVLYTYMIKEVRQVDCSISEYIYKIMLIVFFIGHLKGLLTYYNDYTALMLLFSGINVLKSRECLEVTNGK